MPPESKQHKDLKTIMESKLREWFGSTIREYNMFGYRLDVYAITPTKVIIHIEIIWSKGQYDHDMIILQRSDADIKVIVAGNNILQDVSKVRDYTKFAIKQTSEGRTIHSEMLSGNKILNNPSYVENELKQIFNDLIKNAEKHTSINKILLNVIEELKLNKNKLMSLYTSGQTTYITHLLQTEMWDAYKQKIGEVSYTNVEALSKIYHKLRMLNQSITNLITVVNYSRPPFPRLREICSETTQEIDKWIKDIQSYLLK